MASKPLFQTALLVLLGLGVHGSVVVPAEESRKLRMNEIQVNVPRFIDTPEYFAHVVFIYIRTFKIVTVSSKTSSFQILGTHNSYHLKPPKRTIEFLQAVDKIAKSEWSLEIIHSHSSVCIN